MEEALDSTETGSEKVDQLRKMVETVFADGHELYRGYVQDPRNTDNAWMETVAIHFHDEKGDKVGALPLRAGDDAAAICWMEVSSDIRLFASHRTLVRSAVERLGAHW